MLLRIHVASQQASLVVRVHSSFESSMTVYVYVCPFAASIPCVSNTAPSLPLLLSPTLPLPFSSPRVVQGLQQGQTVTPPLVSDI